MKSFKQIFNEEKQVGVIYHYTNLINALDIIHSNTIKSSPLIKLVDPSISFTRDAHFHSVPRGIGNECRFVIDGT